MRKNTARHWLHATLDLLPVILIPVFMIYSHRHDLSTDITIQQDVYKDFYQGVKNGKPNNLDNITFRETLEQYVNDNGLEIYVESIAGYFGVQYDIDIPLIEYDYYYLSLDLTIPGSLVNDITLELGDDYDYVYYDYGSINEINNKISLILRSGGNANDSSFIYFNLSNDDLDGYTFYFKNVMLFNLTEIFGSDNEPTKEVFESYLTQDYYDFGSNQVKVGTIDVQAKNNDIMSVFMDSFNNSVNKYFNMGNVFNLNNVYEWFNANLFGGNAPVVIYSVYNIVVYELVMDLLFLLYALFMWFIDMLKRLIEKPLDSIK